MTYFANGTEGELFQEENCDKCKNNPKKGMCPIIQLHYEYNYELCNSKSKAKKILDFLIPEWKITDRGAEVPKCSMLRK